MTNKRKLKSPKSPKERRRGRVIDVSDDENFHWLHSMRTPEDEKRLAELERSQLKMQEEVRKEWEEIAKLNLYVSE